MRRHVHAIGDEREGAEQVATYDLRQRHDAADHDDSPSLALVLVMPGTLKHLLVRAKRKIYCTNHRDLVVEGISFISCLGDHSIYSPSDRADVPFQTQSPNDLLECRVSALRRQHLGGDHHVRGAGNIRAVDTTKPQSPLG